ncbi:hypothetical protein OC842_002577 [Tilletia horrida]|uniref:Extracellular membrane protein CFEM domain-containing protein n=1 Tax=Tilletia horrida TaxID=155126 RepID=A0AAN6GF42_9BASI|nr:hypothetical protein OC842_002577 [Tilletia horrida]
MIGSTRVLLIVGALVALSNHADARPATAQLERRALAVRDDCCPLGSECYTDTRTGDTTCVATYLDYGSDSGSGSGTTDNGVTQTTTITKTKTVTTAVTATATVTMTLPSTTTTSSSTRPISGSSSTISKSTTTSTSSSMTTTMKGAAAPGVVPHSGAATSLAAFVVAVFAGTLVL